MDNMDKMEKMFLQSNRQEEDFDIQMTPELDEEIDRIQKNSPIFLSNDGEMKRNKRKFPTIARKKSVFGSRKKSKQRYSMPHRTFVIDSFDQAQEQEDEKFADLDFLLGLEDMGIKNEGGERMNYKRLAIIGVAAVILASTWVGGAEPAKDSPKTNPNEAAEQIEWTSTELD